MKNPILWLFSLVCMAAALPAHAQLGRGDFRLSLDTDVIGVAHVTIDPDGGGPDQDTTVFSLGPNQLGGSHVTIATTPLGLGLGWVLSPKILFGVRLGLGFDVIAPEGDDENRKVLALSLMPGLTFVPLGRKAKLFIAVSPLFQVNRIKQDNYLERWMQGGFSTGVGALIFAASSVSADIGFFFEGRFGNRHQEVNDDEADGLRVADLRGVIRFGLSLWR
jgi:hypothetical protein